MWVHRAVCLTHRSRNVERRMPHWGVPMIEEMLEHTVVIDLRGPYVCLGRLVGVGDAFLDVRDADFHDLRDTQTTRENYIVSSKHTGIKTNRRRVLVARAEVVAVARLKDISED
jgi:hypothetical protein